MGSIKRMALLSVLVLSLGGVYTAPASAHTISEAQAYGVADREGERAYDATAWADTWGDECNRQTPWRFSCLIEIWSETQGGRPDCWRTFDVTSPIFGHRLRIENVAAWRCA